jgi:hypothetical protein
VRREPLAVAAPSAAKVSYDKKKQQIEIENYGIEPVRLSRVRVSGT